MIGLNKHTVEIVEHQSDWNSLGIDTCQQVRSAGGDLFAEV